MEEKKLAKLTGRDASPLKDQIRDLKGHSDHVREYEENGKGAQLERLASEVTKRRQEKQKIEDEIKELISQLEADMFEAADQLEFERAAHIRDQISKLRQAIDPNAPAASADPKARKSGKRKVEY